MRKILLSGLLLAALAVPAAAQINPFGDTLNLTAEDLEIMRKAVRSDLSDQPAGTSTDWSNPKSGNAGTITVNRYFESEGRECRELEYMVTPKDGFEQRYFLSGCRKQNTDN